MPPHDDALYRSVGALSKFFVGDASVQETLDRVAHMAREAVPGCDMAGMTLVKGERPTTAVFTDPASPEIDSAQYETGIGPCLQAMREGEVFKIDSTEDDERWKSFSEACLAKGVLSTLSLPLLARERAIGALNLYSRSRAAFPKEVAEAASDFAAHASIVLANAQAYQEAFDLSEQLSEAMKSRAVIEQAKGILMARQGCTAEEAFDLLRRASQRSNVKLRDIAQELVDRPRATASCR